MILTVVGSGTLVPSTRRSTPALAVEGETACVTVDGGSGTMRRQAELGIDFRRTHTLFFTHVHPDHTLDLVHFLFASRYTPGYVREEPVRLVGPRGFAAFVEHLRRGMKSWTAGGPGGVVVEEMEDGATRTVGDLAFTAIALEHAVTDVGYRIVDGRGRVLAVTGDTGPCDALATLAAGADVLVAECSSIEAAPLDGHLSAADAGRAARAGGVGQLVLTHLYPLPDDRLRVAEARGHYDGPILLADDGDRFVV